MKVHNVKKVVIITEKLISEQVCQLLVESKASGYTISNVGGKGSRNIRTDSDIASVLGGFTNVKIEVIVKDEQGAHEIIEKIVDEFFEDFSGITYIENVEIIRMSKFVIE